MKFVVGESAVIVDDILVLGELHIGMESESYSKGVFMLSGIDDMKKRILDILEDTKLKKIVVLGDVKHNYLKISNQERKEIPDFFSTLCEKAEVHITLGNHDGLLEEILPKEVIVHPTSGWKYNDYFFCHGNAWPSQDMKNCKKLFMAHIHPAIEFIDDLGYRSVEFCWVRGEVNKKVLGEKYSDVELEEIIIVPPFNFRVGGMPLNRKFDEKDISPLTRNGVIDVQESVVFLLDGTELGKVSGIKAK